MRKLDKLNPEVRDSLAIMDRDCPEVIDWQRTAWGIIRAERMRLAKENMALRETVKRLNRRVQVAEAAVAEKIKSGASGSLGRSLANAAADMYRNQAIAAGAALEVAKSAARQAEAELAALKARIADAPSAKVHPSATKIPMGHMNKLAAHLIGKRVRLLIEETPP